MGFKNGARDTNGNEDERTGLLSSRKGGRAVRGAATAGLAPPSQEMTTTTSCSSQELLAQQQRLSDKEAQLVEAGAQVAAKEAALSALCARSVESQDVPDQSADTAGTWQLSARWEALAAERALLAARWQVLVEERRQLTLALAAAAGGGRHLGDFEPGDTPLRDVTCSVITHQLDTPFFSCCFQR